MKIINHYQYDIQIGVSTILYIQTGVYTINIISHKYHVYIDYIDILLVSTWWFQLLLKNYQSKGASSPNNVRVKIKTYLKPPPRISGLLNSDDFITPTAPLSSVQAFSTRQPCQVLHLVVSSAEREMVQRGMNISWLIIFHHPFA